jgi:acetyl esterase/lipase/lysophospholipase L1-like esterase
MIHTPFHARRKAALVLLFAIGCALPSLFAEDRLPHLFLVGDSTMANKPPPPENPEHGWGEALPYFFDAGIVIDNRALNGRSSLSFRTEGHWDAMLADLRAGDWVLIQFGHNDEKEYDPDRYAAPQTDYRANLIRFVEEVREKGAFPLLATSIVRRKFDEAGNLVETHGEYPAVVRQVAAQFDVPLLDLQARTEAWVQALGPKHSLAAYLLPSAGQFARFPEGKVDDTHLSAMGASAVAQMAAEAFRELDLPLSQHLEDTMTDFTKIEWMELYPEGLFPTPEAIGSETGAPDLEWVERIGVARLGIFRSTLGEEPRPAVVICPGGGYSGLAVAKEGIEVARWFNALGFDAFVLKYRVKEFGYPVPLLDVTRAVRLVRSQAKEWGIDPERIGVLGFSAGGHAAAMGTTLYASTDGFVGDALDAVSARPDFSVLIYPVVTFLPPFGHEGSRVNLLGKDATPEQIEALSLETRVHAECPPVFLLHTDQDKVVPAENSLQLATALRAQGVPVELHLFTDGPHGFGMRPGFGAVSHWPQLLVKWLQQMNLAPDFAVESED